MYYLRAILNGLIFGELISEFKFWRSLFFVILLWFRKSVFFHSKQFIKINNLDSEYSSSSSNLIFWNGRHWSWSWSEIFKEVKEEKEDLWFISLVLLFFICRTCIGYILCNHGSLSGFYVSKIVKFLLCQKSLNKQNFF